MIAAAVVAAALARVDALVAQEPGRDARFIAETDKKAEAEYKNIAPLGWKAAAPLGEAATDLKRAPKTRLFATTFLAKIGDPLCYAPLAAVLSEPEQDPDVRLSAAQGLAALDAPAEPVRKTFCATLAQPDLPRPVFDESLIALTRLGCGEPSSLERAARRFGPRPDGADLADVRRALEALAKSRGDAPVRRLLVLADYFPSRTPARAATLAALAARRADLVTSLSTESFPIIREALRSETGDPATTLLLVPVMDAFGPEADEVLLPFASHADAEVLAVSAEALARRKVVAALPALEAVLAGAINDPRFGPNPGRPDPAALLARIEAATQTLRRVRALQK